MSLREPTSVETVAERADCSPNTARKHLADLTELGVARATDANGGTHYQRNDEYVRWRRANRLAERLGPDELLDRVAELEARDESFAAEFGVESPDSVPIPDADHATVEERWESSREWASVRDELSVTREALRMARRDRSTGTADA